MKRPLVIIFISSFIIRLGYLIYSISTFGLDLSSDAGDYIQFAEFILEQGIWVTDITELKAHAGPGFPALIALDFLIWGNGSFFLTLTIGLILNALVPVLAYKMSLKLFGRQFIANITAFWCITYVHYLRYTPLICKENIVFGLFTLSIYIVLFGLEKKRYWPYILFTVIYSYLLHVDERYLFYLPFLIGYMLLTYPRRDKILALYMSLGVAILVIPWTIRNYKVYDRVVILTERTTVITDKLLGYDHPIKDHRPYLPNYYNPADIPLYEAFSDSVQNGFEIKSSNLKGGMTLVHSIKEGNVPKTLTKSQMNLEDFKELMRPFRFEPGYIAYGYRFRPAWGIISNIIYMSQYGILLVSFALSLLLLINRSSLYKFLLAIILLNIIIHVFVAHGIQRYRVPIDFIIIVIGVYGLFTAFERLRGKMNPIQSHLKQ